ncbi:MAG: peptidylprolyl isomerase [Alphaproteobacteria bacterium]|nr:peptidylprolyl isomerase [Alphaproteobacteria bacterium]
MTRRDRRLGAGALVALALAGLAVTAPARAAPPPAKPLTMADILAASAPSDWRTPDPANLMYLDLAAGRVVIELAPEMAPKTIGNIKTLVRANYFDGLAILRVQENYVVQWGDPAPDDAKRPLGAAASTIPAEFQRPRAGAPAFTRLPDKDGYAREVGFVQGFPAGRDRKDVWLAHCPGAVGVGRDTAPDSGAGTELYAVIGHAPRNLDHNVTIVGRVLQGMSLLTTLPRGTGPLGFYETPDQRTPIVRVRLAADLPQSERTPIEVLRTDTATFTALVEARRNRRDEWYVRPAGYIDLCNVPIPVRAPPKP